MDFNKECYIFQKKLIDIFNEEENIPFLLKYYLFKDIWESVEENKFLIDRNVRSNEKRQETISGSVSIPNDFFQEDNSEIDNKEEK